MSTQVLPPENNAPSSRKAHCPAPPNIRFWDRMAPQYAAEPIADMEGYETTLQRVKTFLSAQQDVLEIGCGTGSTALQLAPLTRHMLATDASSEMISIARERLAAQPVAGLSFAVAEADTAASGHGLYDAVLAFNMLHLVNNLDHTLEKLVQALRPGGLLISKTPCVAEMNPLLTHLALPVLHAIGKVPHVLRFDAALLRAAIARQRMDIVSVERHGTRSTDFRVFIVARKPAQATCAR